VERDRAPLTYASWMGIGMNAAANREVAVSFANPTGGGDLVTATWRWWTHRPLIAASYAAPAPRTVGGGTWMVEASQETQTFAPGLLEQTRTRAVFGMTRWMTARIRVGGTIGFESWSERGRTPSMSGRVEFWPVADRLSLDVDATAWTRASGFAAGGAAMRWRSSASTTGVVWLAGSGYQLATGDAPAFVWPGVVVGSVFGRRLAFANTEVQRWRSLGQWPIRIAPAAFVDTARATRGIAGESTPTQVDVGGGVRLSILGLGVLRVDLAHGLRDGSNALSIGFVR